MPKMRNISKRQFVIAGKTLKQGQTDDFAQSVIERHVAMYPRELEAVAGGDDDKVSKALDSLIKAETKEEIKSDKILLEEITETAADNATVEEVAEDAPAPKKRGRKPKAKG